MAVLLSDFKNGQPGYAVVKVLDQVQIHKNRAVIHYLHDYNVTIFSTSRCILKYQNECFV